MTNADKQEVHLGCSIDCSCCSCLTDCCMDALRDMVAVINGCTRRDGDDRECDTRKAIAVVPLPTFVSIKNFKPCGFMATIAPSAPIPLDCMEPTFCEQIVAVVLDTAHHVKAAALRALESAVIKALTVTENCRLPTLMCHNTGSTRDVRLWDATLGKRGFVGIYEETGPCGGRTPIRILLARVGEIPASTELHRKLLDDEYSSMDIGKFIGCSDYCSMRSLCRRNALRVLVVAADKYGLEVPHRKDAQRATRSTEELTPDEESLRRGLTKSSEIVRPTYHNEGATLMSTVVDGEPVVKYYDGCVCTDSAVGGLVYVQDPKKHVFVFDYKLAGITSANELPQAWPMPGQSVEHTVQDPDGKLSELYPAWNTGRIEFKPISLVVAE